MHRSMRSLFNKIRKPFPSTSRVLRPARRLVLEPLEDRAVPTVCDPTGGAGIFLDGPGGDVLCIIGTAGTDWVSVIQVGDELRVYADSITGGPPAVFPAASVGLIEMHLLDGSDIGSVGVPIASSIYGGPGNDFLTGSSTSDLLDGGADDDVVAGGLGNDVVLGGAGNDNLAGDLFFGSGDGNDVIFGGDGSDTMLGGGGSDLLLGAMTAWDGDVAALTEIWAIWNSGLDYEDRVEDLLDDRLDSGNRFDDDDYDQMHGQDGQDWFLGYVDSDAAPDQVAPDDPEDPEERFD